MSTKNSLKSSGESGSEDDSQVVLKSSKRTRRLAQSEDERQDIKTTPEQNVTPTTAPSARSSERLRKKSQRQYSVPGRKETLDKIVVRKKNYEDWNLKPRRLTSDFVRGLNRYVTDRIETFASEDSELSDFIDDSDITTHKKSRRTRPSKKTRKNKTEENEDGGDGVNNRKTRKQKIKKTKQLNSDNEIQSENDFECESATCTGTQRCKKNERLSSNDEIESEEKNDINFGITTRRKLRKRKCMQFSSDDGVQSEENMNCETTTRRSTRKARLMKTKQLSPGHENELKQDRDEISSGEDSEVNCNSFKSGQKSKRNLSSISDEDIRSSSSEDGEHMKLKKNKRRLISKHLDSSDVDELLEPNRKLPQRTKSAKKEKEEALLAKLTAKRKMEKVKLEQQNNKKDVDNAGLENRQEDMLNALQPDSETTQEDNVPIIDSAEDFEEDEYDREFVVDDDYCDADSDGVTEFFKHLHNVDNDVSNERLTLKERKSNSFQRICIPVESDDSADETILDSLTLDVYKAIKEKNIETVGSVLETNPDIVHELGPKRRSLLHYAVLSGSAKITKLLLGANADKFAIDSYSLQPIAYAILTGHIDCLKLLLENTNLHELNKIYKVNFKFSLLHFVVYGKTSFPDLNCEVVGDNGLVQCMQILFEHEENLFLKLMNEKDSRGFTPLVASVIAGHSQCVEFLLYNGSLVDDFQSKNGGSFLHLAVECSLELEEERSCCLKVLLNTSLKHKIDYADYSGFTSLMYAAQSGNHDCVLALLEAGASVSCRDLHGATSLHLAAASGDTQSVKLLLQYGHQVDCLDSCGWPPLLYANFAAQESCVLSLMEPNPKQIFVLGDLLKRGTSEAGKERNFKVVKEVLIALANQDAYYRVFNDFIRRNPNFLDEYDRGLLHKTWRALLDYDNKLRWFKRKLDSLRKDYRKLIRLEVDREAVFESAMKVLNNFSGSSLRNCKLQVTFKNEEGICTGPKREFFVNICKDIVDSRHKLFHLTDDNQYRFLPNAYFAEIAKTEGGPIKDESLTSENKLHSSMTTIQDSSEYLTNGVWQSSVTTVSNGSQDTGEDLTGSSRSSVTTVSSEPQGTGEDLTGSSSTMTGLSRSSVTTFSNEPQGTGEDLTGSSSTMTGLSRSSVTTVSNEPQGTGEDLTGSSSTMADLSQSCVTMVSNPSRFQSTVEESTGSSRIMAGCSQSTSESCSDISTLRDSNVLQGVGVDANGSSSQSISQDCTEGTVTVSTTAVPRCSVDLMDERDDIIIAELDVTHVNPVNSSTTQDSNRLSRISVDPSIQVNTNIDTAQNTIEVPNPSIEYMDERGDVIIAELDTSDINHSSSVNSSVQPNIPFSTDIDAVQNTIEVPNPSVEYMDVRGDAIIAELDTSDINPSSSLNSSTNVDSNEQSCATVDPSVSLYTNMETAQNTIQIPSNPLIEYMDGRGDAIIAELDTSDINHSPSVNSSVQPNIPFSTDIDTAENTIEVPNPSVEYMDERGDEIIAELDASDIEDKKTAMMGEMKKMEFARHVDQKLTKNISQLKFLGRIIGTAICEGFFINLHLCKPIVKQILGMKLSHPDDLSSFDYELHKNLVTFVLESDDVEDLMLPCTLDILNPWNKRCTTLMLFSEERNEEFLNDKNKVEYVDLVSQHKLTVLIKKEMDALCQGLYEVIPMSLFSLFTADEFSLLINGVGKIDVEDWRKNSVYSPRDAASTFNEIKWFWEIVNELKEEEKALLLKFSTGSPCLPAGGFAQLQGLGGATKFHITMKSDHNKIPTASTCFNQLKLPKYDNIKDLKDKLLIAIRHGTEGFSFS